MPSKDNINKMLEGVQISVSDFFSNSGASEKYVCATFNKNTENEITTMVPYVYRRSNMELQTEKDIAEHLISIQHYFLPKKIEEWASEQREKNGDESVPGKFLKILLNNVCGEHIQEEFPVNNNPQKVFQKLKDAGYIIPILRGTKLNGNQTRYWLLPLPLIKETKYETMSKEFVNRVKKVLENWDSFEARKGDSNNLLPDHKFPEIRWNPETATENPSDMPEEEIKKKFQLLSTQRNMQKREACRACFNYGTRGIIYGVKYYYQGTEKWNSSIPKNGPEAEKGCIGCPWYDIQKWRESLQKAIKDLEKNN